jgi:hypothetical protein
MYVSMKDGIRQGIPPFALCRLLARQMRILHASPRELRLQRAIQSRPFAQPYPAQDRGLRALSVEPARSLPKASRPDNAESGDPAYAAIGKYEDLHRLALNGSQLFHSQRAAQGAPGESQG